MRRKRRNHLPGFKAKVAVAAIKGDKTLGELAEQFDVHQNQIQAWNDWIRPHQCLAALKNKRQLMNHS